MEDGILERTKSSSEETLSAGNVKSLKTGEGREISIDNRPYPYESRVQVTEAYCAAEFEHNINHVTYKKDDPTIFRPVARVGAFSVYNSPSGSSPSMAASAAGPLLQVSKPEVGVCKFLEDAYVEPVASLQCGHGCTNSSGGDLNCPLLGPEFVEYEEIPLFSSRELISVATDLNNIAWMKSGLENGGIKIPDNAGFLEI